MTEIQRIHIPKQQTATIFDKYKKTTQQELLTVIGWNEDEVQWITTPKDQQQSEWSVSFDTSKISQATAELEEQWHATDELWFFHNHNRDSEHGFWFSDADLETAKHLHESRGIDRMWLVMNGKTDEDIHIQHMVIANHEWELHDLEWENGTWKVMTMVTGKDGKKHEIFSASIEEAEQKEAQIIALKELLFTDEESEVGMAA